MKSRVFFPRSLRNAVDSDSHRETSAQVEQLILAGRSDAPTTDLAQRVSEAIAYRRVVTETRPTWLPRTRNRSLAWAVLTSSAAVAAGALLWWYTATPRHSLSVAPERVAVADRGDALTQRSGAPRQGSPGIPPSDVHATASPVGSVLPTVKDPCLQRALGTGKQPLIDDFEDGDDEVLRIENRSGLWRWARDTDAPGSAPALLPIPRINASTENRMALHVKGGHLLDWGAIVEFNFKPGCYDASAYRGLRFQARGPGRVFVAPREVGTIPVTEGGTCTRDCYNPHVKKIELDRQWRTYHIEWREFEQRGYGRPAFDPQRLHSLAFLIRPEDTPYDVWFDDVSFISR